MKGRVACPLLFLLVAALLVLTASAGAEKPRAVPAVRHAVPKGVEGVVHAPKPSVARRYLRQQREQQRNREPPKPAKVGVTEFSPTNIKQIHEEEAAFDRLARDITEDAHKNVEEIKSAHAQARHNFTDGALGLRDVPELRVLRSLSGKMCNRHLGGFLKPDKQHGQPRLNVRRAYKAIHELSKLEGVEASVVGHNDGMPVHMLRMRTLTDKHVPNVLITSGIHGNEPVGVTGALELFARVYRSSWRYKYDITFVPMLNPGGLTDNFRTMRNGKDLNRLFFPHKFPPQLEKLEAFIKSRPWALSMDLHGAKKRTGFFLIRGYRDRGLSTSALSKVNPDLLLSSDKGVYPGWVGLKKNPHKYLLKSPGQAKSENPGTMKGFMVGQGVKDSFTVEYPGHLPVCTRQSGLVSVVIDTVNTFARERKFAKQQQ